MSQEGIFKNEHAQEASSDSSFEAPGLDELITCVNESDFEGNPAGGYVLGKGLEIRWQDGPLGRGEDRQEPNGAFVETVLMAVEQRLRYYQGVLDGRFASKHNSKAIAYIQLALKELADRTEEREARGVEGTHEA